VVDLVPENEITVSPNDPAPSGANVAATREMAGQQEQEDLKKCKHFLKRKAKCFLHRSDFSSRHYFLKGTVVGFKASKSAASSLMESHSDELQYNRSLDAEELRTTPALLFLHFFSSRLDANF
jgi:hypothetical protein